MGIKQYKVRVTLRTFDGLSIVRETNITSLRATDAKYRAGIVLRKPGQSVVSAEVVK